MDQTLPSVSAPLHANRCTAALRRRSWRRLHWRSHEVRALQAGMLTRALDTRVAEAAQLRKALEVAKREGARMHAEMDELRQVCA